MGDKVIGIFSGITTLAIIAVLVKNAPGTTALLNGTVGGYANAIKQAEAG